MNMSKNKGITTLNNLKPTENKLAQIRNETYNMELRYMTFSFGRGVYSCPFI